MPPRSAPASTKFQQLIDTAEKLQQRAERARGNAALKAYEEAALAFEASLPAASPSPSTDGAQIIEAHFGAGECFQNWAEALQESVSSLPDSELTPSLEIETQAKCLALFERAVSHYKHVQEESSLGVRVDAAVCCGNALASWAEIVSVGVTQNDLFAQAESMYQHALKQEEDSATWNNLADVLIQHAQALCDAHSSITASTARGICEPALPLFQQALEAYSRACQLSSSEDGDDLPGLLVNWGSGLLAAAGHHHQSDTPSSSVSVHSLLDEAGVRLRQSIAFNRADPAPFNALGDVLVLKAERFMKDNQLAEAAGAIQAALEEGYGGALRINATHIDALVGCAEAEAVAAKACTSCRDVSGAVQRWSRAVEYYARALQQPQSLGSWRERCNVKYNCACGLAGCGKKEEAVIMLQELVDVGAVTVAEIKGDAELAAVHGAF